MVLNKEGTLGWIVTDPSCHIQPDKIDEAGNLTSNGDPVAITQPNQAVGAGGEILLTQDESMIVASNRQVNGSQNDFLTTFNVDSSGLLTNPTTYDTKGQVVRGLAFNNDSTLLVFMHQTNGTVGDVRTRRWVEQADVVDSKPAEPDSGGPNQFAYFSF
jgi:6-phosphogluconolactonase (cycloisomerase 2 family)